MKRLIFTCICVICAVQSLCAQSYYYNKADNYFDSGEDELAVKTLQEGVRAGEVRCYVPLAYSYLQEKGTPRNVARALQLLDTRAKESAKVAHLLAYIYSGEKFYTYDSVEGYYISNFNYDSYSRKSIISVNMTKALYYARLYNKLDHDSYSQNFLDRVEYKCYIEGLGGYSKNYEKAISIARKYDFQGFFNMDEIFETLYENISTIAALAEYERLMEVFTGEEELVLITQDGIFDPKDILSKSCSVYETWSQLGGNLKSRYAALTMREKTLIDYGIYFKVSNAYDSKNENELEYLIKNFPSSPMVEWAKIAWTTLRCNVLYDPTRKVTKEYVDELLKHPYLCGFSGCGAPPCDDFYFGDKESIRYLAERRLMAEEEHSRAYENRLAAEEARCANEFKILEGFEVSYHNLNLFESMLNYYVKTYPKNPYASQIAQMRDKIKLFKDKVNEFNTFLEIEKKKGVLYNLYPSLLKNNNELLSSHASRRLSELSNHRRYIESWIRKEEHLSSYQKRSYHCFISLLKNGDLKELKPEFYKDIYHSILKKSIAYCIEAIKFYPQNNSRAILNDFIEMADICRMLDLYWDKSLTDEDCDAFLAYYPQSSYKYLLNCMKDSKRTKPRKDECSLILGLIPKTKLDGAMPKFSPESISKFVLSSVSLKAPANCYIVSRTGTYAFMTVKGNSFESVGNVASCSVLWESFGTSVVPKRGDLIKSVSCKDGYIIFKTTDKFKAGNAVIAAKDARGTILWSWHIWFTDYPKEQSYYRGVGTIMDRNLGATSATPGAVSALGLLYQWGRKDPFLGSSSISEEVEAKSTIDWPSPVSSNSSRGNIVYATANPTIFITATNNNGNNNDWCYTKSAEDTRWTASNKPKSIYDPCPSGWRVPDGGFYGFWSKASGTSSECDVYKPIDNINSGINFSGTFGSASTIWYPASGYRANNDGSLHCVSYDGAYWSVSFESNGANCMGFLLDEECPSAISAYEGYAADGLSVRCVRDGFDYTKLSANPVSSKKVSDDSLTSKNVSDQVPSKIFYANDVLDFSESEVCELLDKYAAMTLTRRDCQNYLSSHPGSKYQALVFDLKYSRRVADYEYERKFRNKGLVHNVELNYSFPCTGKNTIVYENLGLRDYRLLHPLGINYSIGYRFNNLMSMSLGTGLVCELMNLRAYGDRFAPYYSNNKISAVADYSSLSIPLFLNMKFYMSKEKYQPMISFSGGAYFYPSGTKRASMLLDAGFGYNFRFSKRTNMYLIASFGSVPALRSRVYVDEFKAERKSYPAPGFKIGFTL